MADASSIPDMPDTYGNSTVTVPKPDPLGRSITVAPQQPAVSTDGSSIPDMPDHYGNPAVTPPPESWADWTKRQAAANWQKASTASGMDWGRSALDDASMGFAAPIQGYLTGENTDDIRKRYAASQDALGPIASTGLSAATYALGPGKYVLGPLAGAAKLGKLATAGIEGGMAGLTSGYGHGERDADKLFSDTLYSGAAGVGGAAIAKAINAPGLAKARADDPNFGTGTNYNLRARAKAGEDIGPDVQTIASRLPPGDPTLPGLSDTWDATQRSTEPGKIVKGVSWATQPAARLVNAHFWGVPGFFMSPGTDAGDAVTSIARQINQSSKNAAIQRGLDTATEADIGKPLYTSPSWTNWLHQPLVGASTTR